MKKILLAAAIAGTALTAGAQDAVQRTNFGDNWSIGLDAGATTPLKGHSFFQNMRGNYGIHIAKQLTPVAGVGVEGAWGVNTTSSRTAFDTQYVGAYGTANLNNLFGGFTCNPRKFWIDAKVGMGWGHEYYPGADNDYNYIAAKTGLNFNFAVSDNFSIAVKPGVTWNLASEGEPVQFNAKRANFDVVVGFNYNFGPGFQCVSCPDYSGELAALNDQVNALRAGVAAAATDLAASQEALAASQTQNAALAAALAQATANPVVVSDTTFNSVRFVFFKIGKSNITPDQMPNVEMIADYMKHNPSSTVVIKGYASQDGPEELNIRLAQARAESVKSALVNKYGIKADRIKAEGQGIGHMFKEESWNRVSICTLDEN